MFLLGLFLNFQCFPETANITVCLNELMQLKHSDIRPVAQYTTSQALYAALDKCKDIVVITDDISRLQVSDFYFGPVISKIWYKQCS